MGLSKPSDQNRRKSKTEERLKDNAFLESILNDEYVLVVGSETILRTDLEGTDNTGDSHVLLYNQMLLEREINIEKDRCWTEEEWHKVFEDNLMGKDLLANAEKKIEYNLDDISSELRSLIQTKHFPLILTTSIDGYLETLMKETWGNQLQIVNFYDKNSLDTFYKNIQRSKEDSLRIIPPTLFYVFGKVNYTDDGITELPFVFSEDDAIIAISKWVQIEDNKKKLFEYIDHKRIMAIGCKFNDWKFRFFWYSLKHSTESLRGRNTVAITFDKEKDNSFLSLERYLKKEAVHVENDSRRFMAHVVELLNPNQDSASVEVWENILKSRRNKSGYIFLSYAHEDFPIAYQLFVHLTNSGYNVWLDNKNLYSSDIYESKIQIALAECVIFIPVLSKQVSKDLTEGNLHRFYLNKEWRPMRDRRAIGSINIIPLATNDYDIRESYHDVGFRNFWNIKDEEKDITIEKIENIEHFEQGLDKILKK